MALFVFPTAPVWLKVSRITSLDNDNIYDQVQLETTTGKIIDSYLRRLPTPIWLVSDNGDMFDFPLLKAD